MRPPRIIALLTDFGLTDHYVGVMKGVIFSVNPSVRIVDISHSMSPQNIFQGALSLKTAFRYFPPRTVFLGVIDPGVGSSRPAVIIKTQKYYFVGPDNGLLSLAADEDTVQAVHAITNTKFFLKPLSRTFHGRDIFAPVAARLAKGVALSVFGKKKRGYVRLFIPPVKMDHRKKTLTGKIIDIDHFGNLITNVTSAHLGIWKNSPVVFVKNKKIGKVGKYYAERKPGELLAVIGSKDFLEISANLASSQNILKARRGDRVTLRL